MSTAVTRQCDYPKRALFCSRSLSSPSASSVGRRLTSSTYSTASPQTWNRCNGRAIRQSPGPSPLSVLSGRDTLDDGLGNNSGDNTAQSPARSSEQLLELFFGALTPARKDQHLQIHEFARREIVPRLNHVVHYQQSAARIHALSAGFQYLDAYIIRPVVNDMFHDVRVGAPGHRRKHISACQRATIHHRLERSIFGACHHVRYLVERAFHMRLPRQDRRQQQPVPAPQIGRASCRERV